MNREGLPLIAVICIPFILVSIVFLYFTDSKPLSFFWSVEPIYYVVILPFALGLFAALLKLRKPK